MLKYVNTKIVFQEVPDEITLSINISNCPCHCKGCHSAYLAEDIGTKLTLKELNSLIKSNDGITCVCFMGGDAAPEWIDTFAWHIKRNIPNTKVAWYSGKEEISKRLNLWNFDYIKVGPYIEEKGPLNQKTTNQKFYKVVHTSTGKSKLYDMTHKFWKND